MEMTPEEILRSYRLAKFPQEQIKILADLNLCSRAKIVQILIEKGIDPKELPKLRVREAPPKDEKPKKIVNYRTTLEREIESKLKTLVEKHYRGRCMKWVCPAEAGVPDRIILLPGGRVVFAETKRPKLGKLSKLQNYWGRKLTELGFDVWTIWDLDDLTDFEHTVLKGENG